MVDKILEALDKLGPILYVVIPAVYAVLYNTYLKVKEKKKTIKTLNEEKAKEHFSLWEHEESKRVISTIKDLCNLYKDRSNADLVSYLQLENGTAATSKIQNMFLTCLAEDDRFGTVPKLITRLQRLPYSEVVCWLGKFTEHSAKDNFIIKTPDLSKADYNRTRIDGITGISSVLVAPVFDPENILLGIVVLFYSNISFNGQEEEELDYLHQFKLSVETTLLEYHLKRKNKKKEIGLEV